MKGPKAILASSIATALDDFEIDKDGIQSTLLGDAQISLKEMKLRSRLTQLPSNSWANIEGSVDRASFSWVWGPAGNWVKDATLTINGLRVVATITEENPNAEQPTTKKRQSLVENMEEAAQSHAANPDEISNQGGISGYIQTQVQKIIDSMKLRVEKYELSIVLPKQQQVVATENDDEDSIEVQEDGAVQIDTRGEILELISLGRIIPTNPDVSSTTLEQELILQDFVLQIQEISSGDDSNNASDPVVLDLVERFSYKASSHRSSGQRFDRIMENLQVQGHGGDLKVHLGTKQIKALSYLGVLLMAPPSEVDAKEEAKEEEKTNATEVDKDTTMIAPGNTPSHFDFDLGLLQLTMDTNRMELRNAKFVYRADGTIMKLQSDGFAMQGGSSSDPYTVKVSKGMQADLKTPLTLTIGSIDEIFMPYTAKLTKPIANTKIIKEGLSYAVEFADDVQIEMLKSKEQEEDNNDTPPTEASAPEEETKTEESQYKANVVPFPLSVSVKHLVLTKEEDDNRTDFQNLYAFANPTDQGTEFAVDLGKVQNYLLSVEDALVAGKMDQDNQINKFRFSAQQVQVTAGHTPGEWAAAFEPTGTAEEKQAQFQKQAEARKKKSQQEQRQSQQQESSPPMKFPNCYIDPLRLTISWKAAGSTIAVKDTKVTVKEFHGKDDTTANDLVQYYVQSCLAHASDFIPNAQLLGLNVVDSTMGTVGNYIGMATLGPLGGIAAIGAVDAVKQTISAGKKSRNRDDGARTHAMDVVRGLAYTIQENLGSNPINFAQDTIGNTGAYIDENKARLGGAGVGGAGMILGGIFGGPAGAIVAGVLSQAVAEKVITTTFDDTTTPKKEPLKLEA